MSLRSWGWGWVLLGRGVGDGLVDYLLVDYIGF